MKKAISVSCSMAAFLKVYSPSFKKKRIRLPSPFFCFLLVSLVFACSATPLSSNYDFFGLPLIIFENPSLVGEQQGTPAGCELYSPLDSGSIEVRSGVVVPFRKNAFSVGYSRLSQGPFADRIVSGFSHRDGQFSYGSSFQLLWSGQNLGLSIDAAGTYFLSSGDRISLLLSNVVASDTLGKILFPKAKIIGSGPLPLLSKIIGYDCSAFISISDFNKGFYTYGGSLAARARLSENPSVHFSGGLDIFTDDENAYHEVLSAGVGATTSLRSMRAGVFGGVRYELVSQQGGLYGGIYVNPLATRDLSPPDQRLRITCSDSITPGLFIAIRSSDNDGGSGIKQWTLVIADGPSKNAAIIRSYSGGEIPPSTIFWDYRDLQSRTYDENTVYVRLILVDRSNNISASRWHTIHPCAGN